MNPEKVESTYFKSKYPCLFQLHFFVNVYDEIILKTCKKIYNFTNKIFNYYILRKLNNSPNIIKLYDTFESRTHLILITDLFDHSKCNVSISLLNKHNELIWYGTKKK